MMSLSTRLWSVMILIAVQAAVAVQADVTLLDQSNLIAAAGVAQPSEYSFTTTSAQALTLTLTDLQTPAAFQSLKVAVTLGDALVGSASIDPTTHTATVSIPAATGTYTVDVIGTPDATQQLGSFGVCVAPATSATSCVAADSYSGSILAPTTASTTNASSFQADFTSTTAGTYTVTLTDDVFPAALQSVGGGITSGSTAINSTGFVLGTNQVTLAAATSYRLTLAALADSTVKAGLYSVHIVGPAGVAVLDRTTPVGTMSSATVVGNSTAQQLNMTLSDYDYPTALASVGAAVTQGSSVIGKLTAPGSLSGISAAASDLEVWQFALAGAQPGVYSFGLSSASAGLYSTTQVVQTTSSTSQSFAFAITLPAAGSYTLTVNDFQFPTSLQSLSATVAQNGALLQQSSSGVFTAAAGVAIVVVDAVAPSSGSAIFGVSVQSSDGSQTVLDQTQAVGGDFQSQTVTVSTAGGYNVALADLGFPAAFSDLAVVVSRGATVVGKIFNAGTFKFTGSVGAYQLTTVATPSSQNYGLYSVDIAAAAPTVTFSAGSSSVTAGNAVTLTWSSTDTSSCTASGGGTGWSGTEATSGTLSLTISATETLTLTCTGAGGTAAQSVTVTATAAASKSGGGALDGSLIGALGALLWLGRRCRLSRPG
ncbi:MAG: hypothetical protein M3N97_15790 [Pseudomonadota bacterium]|nr:hypothetical protein [Pseudomonadota bacterium]